MQRSRLDAESPEKAVLLKKVQPNVEIAKAYAVKEEGTYTVILVVEGVKLYVIGEVNMCIDTPTLPHCVRINVIFVLRSLLENF